MSDLTDDKECSRRSPLRFNEILQSNLLTRSNYEANIESLINRNGEISESIDRISNSKMPSIKDYLLLMALKIHPISTYLEKFIKLCLNPSLILEHKNKETNEIGLRSI